MKVKKKFSAGFQVRLNTAFFYGLLLGLFVFTASVMAGPIEDEYNKTVDDLANAENTPENRKAQLEKTLNAALVRGLVRYHTAADAKDAKISDYEKSEADPFTIFFRYKDFIGFFRYQNDPEKYFSFPVEERIIKKPQKK